MNPSPKPTSLIRETERASYYVVINSHGADLLTFDTADAAFEAIEIRHGEHADLFRVERVEVVERRQRVVRRPRLRVAS